MAISRDDLTLLARKVLADVLVERGKNPPDSTEADVAIFGRDALLDSLGLVTLLMELEARLLEAFDVSVVIADDRAMSRKNSPFRTLSSLVDYIQARLESGVSEAE